MSVLSNKSQLNYASAEHLQKIAHYCSVVHCSYYSSFQLMKHILLHKIGKTESEISIYLKNNAIGSHNYMISEIILYLKSLNNGSLALFSSHIASLKKLRITSDYGDVNIDVDHGRNSILLSEEINKILQRTL